MLKSLCKMIIILKINYSIDNSIGFNSPNYYYYYLLNSLVKLGISH
jgi:hypothetical protein